MSIPFGNETVTLIHKTSTEDMYSRTHIEYVKILLTECSWIRTQKQHKDDAVHVPSEVIICRIPPDQKAPHVGDMLILGNYTGSIANGQDFQRVIEGMKGNGGAFLVASVSDLNRPGFPLPHIKASS